MNRESSLGRKITKARSAPASSNKKIIVFWLILSNEKRLSADADVVEEH
jgi:hypothetical protein